MISEDQRIRNLISRYLEGTLSVSERDELYYWLKESGEHASRFRKQASEFRPGPDPDLEKSLEILLNKRHLREEAEKYNPDSLRRKADRSTRTSTRKLLKYAAVLFLGILGSLFISDQIRKMNSGSPEINWIHMETVAGQKAKLVLPDSTVVWLNSETTLSFPSDYLSLKNRVVKLEGEAFFDVRDQYRNRFIVQSPDYDIRVRGTKFNVMAYRDFNRTETTLVEGSIIIERGKKIVQVFPGERVIYSMNYLTKSKAHVRQATLWKENKFYFDNVPFNELIRRLERWYDVDITLKDKSLNNEYYSGYFKNEETIWQVLDVIKMTTPISYERKQFRKITIDRK